MRSEREAIDMANSVNPWWDYVVDATQRQILFWDVMRQRGNQFNAHNAEATPNVLDFEFEIIAVGAELEQPVNYGLARIVPPAGVQLDPRKPPLVVIDPRAGHGPGISGFKADSEIGVAFREGHACYVLGFLPEPIDGQTIEDVMKAEVVFIEQVAARHPDAAGKPIVVGNCQGGWALMMLAAYRPDLCGPLILAGSPLTYWAGVHGKNPMRYSGGWLGGTWLTRLTSDLGAGKFDGAWLVANFEGMNPANTFWTKQYNLYRAIDTEPERYLQFEKYWGGYAVLNGEEMQFIVDNLFVGNRLPTGGVVTSDGVTIDYRKITSPIVCFCSWGDNITPPQQALGWVLDLYEDVNDIRASGQTIVYCMHEDIGHLGIFVSGRVSRKEHTEFATNLDFINVLPPGLYEMALTARRDGAAGADSDPTDFVATFEPRTLEDIRALGANDLADERRFAAVQRLSEINNALYQRYAQPFIQAAVTPLSAKLAREWHPNRMIYRVFSDENPWMRPLEGMAEQVRQVRAAAPPDNPFWRAQAAGADALTRGLNQMRDIRDAWIEQVFLVVFGDPTVQAALGLPAGDAPPRPRPGRDPGRDAVVADRIEDLRARIPEGGRREAFVRAALFVNLPGGVADERRFAVLKHLVEADGADMDALKRVIREQFFMILLDEDAAVAALPGMVGDDPATREPFLTQLETMCTAAGPLTGERARRLTQIRAAL